MADWLYGGRPPSDVSAAEQALGEAGLGGGFRPARGAVLIPLLQILCIAAAAALVALGPPTAGALAWLLGAIAVPLLWAWFFVEFKRREVGAGMYRREATRRRLNHVLLLVGLFVGMWGAFGFATEVAK